VLVLTIGAVASFAASDSRSAAVSVLVAGGACVGLILGWAAFQRMVTSVSRRAVADHEAAIRLRTEADSQDAASSARQRWASAGLQESISLLRRIAEGQAEPEDALMREACGAEEAFLRQLTQINPELVRMGEWFAQALAEARRSKVRLTIRSGAVDTEPAIAPELGRLLLMAVSAAPGGEQLTATLFPISGSMLRLTLVGPAPGLSVMAGRWNPPAGSEASVRGLGSQDLVEVVVPLGSEPWREGTR